MARRFLNWSKRRTPPTRTARGTELLLEPLEPRMLLASYVAYNDIGAGALTHANATLYDNLGETGFLKDIDSGTNTPASLTIGGAGFDFSGDGRNPAAGTDADSVFGGYVDFEGSGSTVRLDGADSYTHKFTGLDKNHRYEFVGTAVTGMDTYTDRWTLVTLIGAKSYTAAHSEGPGVVTAGLASNQVALWTGANHLSDQGYVARWLDIAPGTDGEFQVMSTRYTGRIPTSVDPAGVADGPEAYALSGVRLSSSDSGPWPDARQWGPSTRLTSLIISEIMYHPADPDGVGVGIDPADLEYVEIFNTEEIPIELSRFELRGDADFDFPEGTYIDGRSYLVIASNPAVAESFYGISGVMGPFSGDLSDGGGQVRLENQMDAIMLALDYSDDYPWPAAADGAGHSLALTKPDYGEYSVLGWEASTYVGGNPGASNPAVPSQHANLVINEVVSHTDLPQQDFVELYNHSGEPVDLSGYTIKDTDLVHSFTIPNGTTIAADGYVSFNQTELGYLLEKEGGEVYLFTPAGDRVVDAIKFGAQPNLVPLGRYPDGGPEFRVLSAATEGSANAGPANNDIVINEIMYHPISEDNDDEYVELFNRGASAVDVSDWAFTNGISYTMPAGTTIPAGGFLVVAANPAQLIAAHPGVLNTTNTIGSFSGSLSDRGEHLVLSRPEDSAFPLQDFVTIDEVIYGDGGQWGDWSDGGGSSLELIDPHSDNMRATNWADSDDSAKGQWALIEYTGVLDLGKTGQQPQAARELQILLMGTGEALIDDIEVVQVINPGTVNEVEGPTRVQNGGFESGLSGWTMQGTHIDSKLETTEGHEGNQSFRIVASRTGDNSVNRVEIDLLDSDENSWPLLPGETATIRAWVRWLRGTPGILLRFHGNWLELSGVMAVPTNLGTPGAINSQAVVNAGPSIDDVSHSPVLPAAGEPVTVTARVEDVDGLASVLLKYRLDTSNPGVTQTVTMTDDGQGADAIAGDGIYAATIPGQPANDTVAFHVAATDGHATAATTTYPLDAPEYEGVIMFGQSPMEGAFGSYRFWMTEANYQEWRTRQKLSDEPIPLTFIYGDERVIYDAGGRYRGSPFIRPGYSDPQSNVSFVFYAPKDDRVLGSTSFNLDRLEGDNTNQRERLSLWLADQTDTEYFHQRYVKLYVNETPVGLIYGDSHSPNDDYVAAWFPSGQGGELFKIDDWFEFNDGSQVNKEFNENGRLLIYATTGGELKQARYRWSWFKEPIGAYNDDYSQFFALVEAMNQDFPSAAYTTQVKALVDVEQWMRVFALRHVIGDWDSYGYNRGKNMSLYKPTDDKWKMIMWDLDHSHLSGSTTSDLFAVENGATELKSKFYVHPEFRRAYWRALSELANGPMVAANFDPMVDAQQAQFLSNGIVVTEDPTSPNTSVKKWVADRRSYVLLQLASVAADFEITTNGGDNVVTDQPLFTVSGMAPVEIATFKVNGVKTNMWFDTVNGWNFDLGLAEGPNQLTVEGFDRQGNLLGSDSITVTFTNTNPSPVDQIMITEIMYNPASSAGEAEFLELHNLSTTHSFDLANWRVDGIGYTFPSGSFIGPGEYMVLVENTGVYSSVYGNPEAILGEYPGGLAGSGEIIKLEMPDGGGWLTIDEVEYDDENGWPPEADGGGPSLQVISLAHDNNWIGNWAVDNSLLYTPGAANSVSGVLPPTPELNPNGGHITPGFQVTITADRGDIYYTTDGSDPTGTDGNPGPTAQLYTGPVGLTNTVLLRARAYDTGSPNEWSAVAQAYYHAEPPASADNLALVELNYHPADPTPDELLVDPGLSEADFEFIELLNTSAETISLLGMRFIEGIQFEFDPTGPLTLAPGQRLVLTENPTAFETRYGAVPNAVGPYSGSLSNGGELVRLVADDGSDIVNFIYSDSGSWSGRADGKGATLELVDPDGDLSSSESWRASVDYGGSPGSAGSGDLVDVVINEVLSNTTGGVGDRIELFNTSTSPVNVGGWYLSDSWGLDGDFTNGEYTKYQIPPDTTIPGGGYLVLDESDFNPTGGAAETDFTLSGPHGGDLWLMAADAGGNLTRFAHHAEFGPAAAEESFGLWPNGQGELYPMISNTFGAQNSGPRIGPLIISEVMYHPTPPTPDDLAIYPFLTENDLEYIEIYNPSGQDVDLTGWRIGKGIDYAFPEGFVLQQGRLMVILPFDPYEVDAQGQPVNQERTNAFRRHYLLHPAISVYGGYTGLMDNGGERIQLQRPDESPPGEPNYTPMLLEDEILYDDASPWPTDPDGAGKSLTRFNPAAFGHFASSWASALPSPGINQLILSTFEVADFVAGPSGFFVQFNRPFDAEVLNLYDVANHSPGPADVTLVGDTAGPVAGSLILGTDSFTFVATGGPLEADNYTFTLRGAEGGLQDETGLVLDGDLDGTPGGDYSRVFGVAPESLVVGPPDFTRGPGQAVDIPANGTGWPLVLTDNRVGGGDVKAVSLTITYDPALLAITGASLGPDAPAGASVSANTSIPGKVTLSFSSPTTPLGTGASRFVRLSANVPWPATYGSTALIDVSGLRVTDVNGAVLVATEDDAVQAVAYFGDATGNGGYSGLDAQRVARVGVGLDDGFAAYPLIDPVVIADVTGASGISGLDAQRIASEAVGIDVPEIPPIPQPLRLDDSRPSLREGVSSENSAPALTENQLLPVVELAIAQIDATRAVVPVVDIRIVDLPGDLLGVAAGSTIQIDVDAAGYGWHVGRGSRVEGRGPDGVRGTSDAASFSGPGPLDSRPSTLDPGPSTLDSRPRIDLLTVLLHEFGHVLGRHHEDEGVMHERLAAGERHVWDDASDAWDEFQDLEDILAREVVFGR